MGLLRRRRKKEGSPLETSPAGLFEEESIERSQEKLDKENTLNLGWHWSENREEFQLAKITEADRASHFYVIGATGTGKTMFLEYLINQDIGKDNGFGIIDPHGDLIEDIKGFLFLQFSPDDERLSEGTILIDPSDPDHTITFNPLEKIPGVPMAEQANELISAFRKIWSDSWGVRMEDLMRNSLIAMGEAELTLTELPQFLTHRSVRQGVLEKVRHPLAQEYFKRFDSLTDRGQVTWIEPIMNKINAFFSDERIRLIFSSEKSSFNLREIMDSKKILLVKLDKGKLKDSADLLGSLIMAKIQMAAFSRSDLPQNKRTPFYLYIDEFQNFASESFSVVLSEARKYGLRLIMAHQTLAQIPEELRSLILGNTGVQVYFRLNRHDAQTLAKEAFEYSGFEVKSVSGHGRKYWSLGEEWEKYTSELQSLPLRVCYVKHKIEGGVIPIRTVDIETAQEIFFDLAGANEAEYMNLVGTIPFGRKYLVSREEPNRRAEERRGLIKEKAEVLKPNVYKEKKEVARPKAEISEPEEKEKPKTFVLKEIPKEEIRVSREKDITQHRYLQNLIKKIAEDKGYKATIEQLALEGQAKIDVALERNGKKIACEISITSTDEQEVKNIEKCLAARYEKVILCSPEKKTLAGVNALISEKLSKSDQAKILYLQPEELLHHLDELEAAEQSKEERIKGYKVKVRYQATREEEKKAKREAVAQVILQAMKRMREKK